MLEGDSGRVAEKMKDLLIKTLETLGYDVFLQGTIADDEPYPESFITFFTTNSSDYGFYDGEPSGTEWAYTIIFYTSNPELMSSVPKTLYSTLKSAGFIPQGKGRDVPSDEPTHTGWANEYLYLDI